MENNIDVFIEQVKNNKDDELKKCIEERFEKTRTQSMKLGAIYISAAIMGKIEKHLGKPGKTSLRDYERCVADIKKIISVQLTQQNDSKEVMEEEVNDGTAE